MQPTADESSATGDQRAWVQLLVLCAAIVAWFVLIQKFGQGDVYAVLGPFACAVCAVSIAIDPRAAQRWLLPSARAALIGVGVGAAMLALTYPIYRLGIAIEPRLEAQVQALYAGARSTTLGNALAWLVSIALAEELLFRGSLPAVLQHWLPKHAAFAVGLVAYSLTQYGTGSWIVMAMAAGCGSAWTLQRVYTDSLLSPLISHLIWSPTVILFYPVT